MSIIDNSRQNDFWVWRISMVFLMHYLVEVISKVIQADGYHCWCCRININNIIINNYSCFDYILSLYNLALRNFLYSYTIINRSKCSEKGLDGKLWKIMIRYKLHPLNPSGVQKLQVILFFFVFIFMPSIYSIIDCMYLTHEQILKDV